MKSLKSSLLAFFPVLVLSVSNFGLISSPGFAQSEVVQSENQQAATDATRELEEVRSAITLSEERRTQLLAEIEQLEGDRALQNAELIAAAQRVKLTEIEVDAIEERLGIYLDEEVQIRLRLESADTNVAGLLAALQRIGKNPPPALIIDPSDALNSARSASLMAALLPQLRQRAETIISDLAELTQIKSNVEEQQSGLTARLSNLLEEQLRIATLIAARKRGLVVATGELENQEREAEALAAEATSLDQLIAALEQRINAVAEVVAGTGVTIDTNSTIQLLPEAIVLALANTQRTTPAMPFTSAKGFLVTPAAGVVVIDFGTDDGFGGISQGISIVTRAQAQVVAPVDGWVLYKGPYLNYGQIIIINPGQGHTILLAGLDTISVELGQFVLMGEPMGAMGSRTIGQTVTTSAGVSRPTLYIELRNQNVPLDPAPWWTTDEPRAQTQSG